MNEEYCFNCIYAQSNEDGIHCYKEGRVRVNGNNVCEDFELIEQLKKENEQLKQRNENQYNQLNQLWQLIEAKDWETLTEMNNKMKEDKERLQREWKYYEMSQCKDYGYRCLVCPYWNHYSRFCTKYKIWSETDE